MSGTWTPGPDATTGNDTFVGSAGNDTANGLAGDDSLHGGAGDDSLFGSDGNDTIDGGPGADYLDGGAGFDFVSYDNATEGVYISIQGASGVITGGAAAGDTLVGFEGFEGSNFDDTILSPNGGYALFGNDGNDFILSGQQKDTVVGGGGSDTIFGGQQNDSLAGGYFRPDSGEAADDNATDYIIGGTGADTAWAGQGDIMAGGNGNDFAYLPDGYADSGQDSVIAMPNEDGTTTNMTFDVWTSTVPGSQPIYLNGFEYTGYYTSTPCYATGTMIATARGEVAVEDLRVGDLVVTAHGGAALQPIVWIGHSKANVAKHPNRSLIAPVLIKAGALGEGAPHRDLRVSPDHAMFLDGRLVPAKLLVNGTTVIQEMWCPEVTYWHVELPAHGLLVAEGAVAESYFDDGNRKQFDNFGITTLFKDFASERGNGKYAEAACYPLLEGGEQLDRIRARLAARAAAVEATEKARRTA